MAGIALTQVVDSLAVAITVELTRMKAKFIAQTAPLVRAVTF